MKNNIFSNLFNSASDTVSSVFVFFIVLAFSPLIIAALVPFGIYKIIHFIRGKRGKGSEDSEPVPYNFPPKPPVPDVVKDIPRVEIEDEDVQKRRVSPNVKCPPFRYTSLSEDFNPESLFPLVVVDVETTGRSASYNEIIQVSAIKYESGFSPTSCFTTYCRPIGRIPYDIVELTNIYDELVENYPRFPQVASAFSEYIKGCNIAGHKLNFDVGFLFYGRTSFDFKNTSFYDTLTIARSCNLPVKNNELETLCEYYGIKNKYAHDSLYDCYATGRLLECLVKEKTKITI